MRFDLILYISRIFCVWFLLLGLLGCEQRSPEGLSPSDGSLRLAVLSPALADTLHALGHGELIVGRQQYDRFTDPTIPIVGDLTGIDYESLILSAPTHIVAQETAAGLPERLLRMAQDRGWEVMELPLLTLDDVIESISAMDTLGGGSGRSEDLERAFEDGLRADLDLGKTVIVASDRPLSVIGPGAFHWELVQQMGGQPIPESGPAYLTLDAESLAAMEPETIVILLPGGDPEADREQLLGAASGLSMPALERGRLIVVTDERCMLPSTSMLRVIEQIRAQARSFDADSGL